MKKPTDDGKLYLLLNMVLDILNSQVNWLELETRIRKMVRALVEPITNRNLEDRKLILLND